MPREPHEAIVIDDESPPARSSLRWSSQQTDAFQGSPSLSQQIDHWRSRPRRQLEVIEDAPLASTSSARLPPLPGQIAGGSGPMTRHQTSSQPDFAFDALPEQPVAGPSRMRGGRGRGSRGRSRGRGRGGRRAPYDVDQAYARQYEALLGTLDDFEPSPGFNFASILGFGGRIVRTNGMTSHAAAGASPSARLQAFINAIGRGSSYGEPPEPPKPVYSRRASHPNKLFPGFKRNVQSEDATPALDLDGVVDLTGESPPKQTTAMGALCASCGSPLRTGMPADGRPWVLKCGHLVDAPCVAAARVRKSNQPGRWRSWTRLRKRKDDDEWLPDEEIEAKGKQKAKLDPSVGDDGRTWLDCPVEGCDGGGTDFLAFEGPNAPWEAFL